MHMCESGPRIPSLFIYVHSVYTYIYSVYSLKIIYIIVFICSPCIHSKEKERSVYMYRVISVVDLIRVDARKRGIECIQSYSKKLNIYNIDK